MLGIGPKQIIDWNNFNSGLVIEVTRPQGKFTCTGVAVKRDLVLTAAHCLEGQILSIKIFNQATYCTREKFWKGEQFEIHPQYNKSLSNYKYDIARIQLAEKLPSSTIIYPIILHDKNLKGKIYRIGYGQRSDLNIRTLVLPEFKYMNSIDRVLELNDMYSYAGDSGGPIFVQDGGNMTLVAIHSTLSYGPEGKFSYNPLLASHREWVHASWN